MTEPVITAVPLVSIPGRSVAIVPDVDPAYTGQAFYTVDFDATDTDCGDVLWWKTPAHVRSYADEAAREGYAEAPLWAAVADIIEKATT